MSNQKFHFCTFETREGQLLAVQSLSISSSFILPRADDEYCKNLMLQRVHLKEQIEPSIMVLVMFCNHIHHHHHHHHLVVGGCEGVRLYSSSETHFILSVESLHGYIIIHFWHRIVLGSTLINGSLWYA